MRLARETGNIAQVARDLDVHVNSLHNWIKQADTDEGKGPEGALTTSELEELRALRRKVRVLEQERDFLKKAATFFAKEQDRPTN